MFLIRPSSFAVTLASPGVGNSHRGDPRLLLGTRRVSTAEAGRGGVDETPCGRRDKLLRDEVPLLIQAEE